MVRTPTRRPGLPDGRYLDLMARAQVLLTGLADLSREADQLPPRTLPGLDQGYGWLCFAEDLRDLVAQADLIDANLELLGSAEFLARLSERTARLAQ